MRYCSLFTGLSENEFQMIQNKFTLRKFHRQESLFQIGAQSKSIYILKKGVIKVMSEEKGKQYIIEFLKPGDFFGEIGLFSDGISQVHIQAVTECEVYQLKQTEVEFIMANIPIFTYNLLHHFSKKLREHRNRLYCLAFHSVKQRLIHKLIYLADVFRAEERSGKMYIDLPVSQKELAYFIGSTRENTSRLLSELKKAGILDFQTRKIILLNEEKLHAQIES